MSSNRIFSGDLSFLPACPLMLGGLLVKLNLARPVRDYEMQFRIMDANLGGVDC